MLRRVPAKRPGILERPDQREAQPVRALSLDGHQQPAACPLVEVRRAHPAAAAVEQLELVVQLGRRGFDRRAAGVGVARSAQDQGAPGQP